MRTTITLDDDVYELASMYASGRGITLGAAVGELVRKANSDSGSTSGRTAPRIRISKNGLPVFSSGGKVITSEMVKATQEDDIE